MSGRSGTATCALGANQSAFKRGRRLPYCLLLSALLLGAAILQKDGGAGFPTATPRSNAQWAHLYAALPLSFEANRGQTDPSVNFLSKGRGFTLFLTGREAVLTLKNPSSSAPGQKAPASDAGIRLKLLGANAQPLVTGKDELPGKANYFLGNNPSKWHTNIPTYAKVRYEGIYPGIDLVYYGTHAGELEYDFVVAPGTDPHAISLGIETQALAPLRINSEGNLVVPLSGGDVQLHKPVVYQETMAGAQGSNAQVAGDARVSSHRQSVEGHYALDAQNRLHFELGPYDHNRPLVIDPVLSYATYIGGGGGDIGYAIAVDSSLDAYIAGVTNSSNFPAVGSPYQSSYRGNGDCFVTKINTEGTQLLYSTYIGGSESDTATAIAVSNGAAFITGNTDSADFPTHAPTGTTTTNPFQLNYGGNTDAFVAQLDATGSSLVYSSYLGGSGADFGQGIAVDSSGNAYVTGATQSTNFPVTAGSLQQINKGSSDAFVAKVNFTGEALVYSTYLGGTQADVGQSIQVDSSGNAYVAGYTFSPDFPLQGPIQHTIGGGADAFVAKLNATGTALTYSTFLGGSGDDRAYGIALDSTLNAYITGSTISTNFPTTTGAFQPALKGSSDAFVCKLNPAGSTLVYSTYLGGSGVDQANGIAVIPSGTNAGVAFVTGFTESSDFPTHSPVQAILGLSINNLCGTAPCPDAFVTQLNASGTFDNTTYSTYLGGNGPDYGQAIAVDSTGDPYITGSTSSTNFPTAAPVNTGLPYVSAYKTSLNGTAGNAFVAKFDSANYPSISISPSSLAFGNETVSVTSPYQQVTIVNPSTTPLVITQIQVAQIGTSTTVFTETDNCVGTIAGGGGYCTMNVAFTPPSTGSFTTGQITLTDNAGGVVGSTQTIALTGSGVTAASAVTVSPTSLSFTSQAVGTVSPAQSVAITNTGTQTLNITAFSVGSSGDYSYSSQSCLALGNTLGVGQSCTVLVSFNPTASGTRSGSLSITDNATGSPQAVSLTGIGAAAFALTAPSSGNNNPVIVGSTQTTFTIVANSVPNVSFNGAISLACSSGSTCAFTTNPIFIGQNTQMVISNLQPNPASNPYAFSVTGTSGSQNFTLQLNLEFEDFTLTASPSVDTIEAGTPASYTILVNPLYTFNSQLQLSCYSGMPPDATCTWSNSQPTPNGASPASVTLTVNTVKYVAPTHAPPPFPYDKLPPLILGLLSLAGLASLALGNRRRGRHGWLGSGWLGVRLAVLSLILALNLALAACRPSTLVISGTTTGNYVITVQGTLLSNTAVERYTTMNLSVTSSQP